MSQQRRIFLSTWSAGITNSKGGCIIPIPKGYYFRFYNAAWARIVNTVKGDGYILYDYRNKVAKLPNYTRDTGLGQNVTAGPYDKPRWLYSYGNTRRIMVSKDNSNWITIAEGVTSATVEPSALFYIPAGYYFQTTGTENTIFECME